jgi:hypothetical protein
MRTRTKNPDGFMDGARRDRCAILAEAVREWRAVDTNTAYTERGSPWENGYIESLIQISMHYWRARREAATVT